MGVKRKITRATKQDVTIYEAFDTFIDEKKSLNKSKATITSFEGSFKRWSEYIESREMSTNLEDIDTGHFYAFSNYCLNEEMKPTTLNHYLRDIRAFLYWCMEKKLIDPPFKVKLVTEQEVIKETYSDDEKLALIRKPSKNASFVEWRTWAIINWILATGNRASTVCEMKLGDLNYQRKEIIIRKTKTNKAMILPFSSALIVVMREYTKMWRNDADDESYLFPNVGEEQLTVNALKHSIAKYNKNRGVEKTSTHALRHTFAKDWIRNTGDVFRLQKLLGHSTLEMTRRYVNMFSEDLKQGFEEYNPLDRLKKNNSRTQKVIRNDI